MSVFTMRVLALAFVVLFGLIVAATTESDCINVEEPGYAGGDRQCFGTDEFGMV